MKKKSTTKLLLTMKFQLLNANNIIIFDTTSSECFFYYLKFNIDSILCSFIDTILLLSYSYNVDYTSLI